MVKDRIRANAYRALTREIDHLVDAIAKGQGDPAVLGPRSTALHEERKRVAAELEAAPPAAEVIALHPVILSRYEGQLASLQEALGKGVREGDTECAGAIRELVDAVTVFRDPARFGGVQDGVPFQSSSWLLATADTSSLSRPTCSRRLGSNRVTASRLLSLSG